METRSDDRLVRNSQVTLERVGDDAVLYDRRNGQAHVLNASAARLWDLCDEQPTLDQATQGFAAGYGISPDEVRGDVEQLVATFRDLGVFE